VQSRYSERKHWLGERRERKERNIIFKKKEQKKGFPFIIYYTNFTTEKFASDLVRTKSW